MGTETLLKFKLHRDSNKLPAYAYEVTVKKMILHVSHRVTSRRSSIPDRASRIYMNYIRRYVYIDTCTYIHIQGLDRRARDGKRGEGIFGFVQNISSLLPSLPTRRLCNGDALCVKSPKPTFILHFEQAEIAQIINLM